MSLMVLTLLSVGTATSHDLSAAKTPTEEAVFGFYLTWKRMPERAMSCCGNEDCHIVQVQKTNGKWYFLDRFTNSSGWREIPEERLEHNAADPRESPDGNSHVCFTPNYVLCAVLGSGQ